MKAKLFQLTNDIAKEHNLTDGEHDLLTCLCLGMDNEAIYKNTRLSVNQANNIKRQIYAKFGLEDKVKTNNITSFVLQRLLEKL